MADYPGITDGDNAPYRHASVWSYFLTHEYRGCSNATTLAAVRWDEWQTLRLQMKGMPLKKRHHLMEKFVDAHRNDARTLLVTHNYVDALKRGGMINVS